LKKCAGALCGSWLERPTISLQNEAVYGIISSKKRGSASEKGELVEDEAEIGPGRRRAHRYKLEAPVRVKPEASSAPAIEASCKDVSAHGMYLLLSEDLELGSELELEITLPPEWPGRESSKVLCHGKVTRLEPRNADGKIGIGAEITNLNFSEITKSLPGYSYKSWLAK
jgi:hypothetical protein